MNIATHYTLKVDHCGPYANECGGGEGDNCQKEKAGWGGGGRGRGGRGVEEGIE